MSKKVTVLEERLVYSESINKWVKVYFDRVRFSDGHEGYHNRIVEKGGLKGVAILPINRGKIGLVKQYRYPIGKEAWEIPRGFGESDHTRLEALRELEEETGIKLPDEKLLDIGSINPNSGILSSEVALFVAMCEGIGQNDIYAQKEVDEFRWFKLDEVANMIINNDLKDAFTICAIYKAIQHAYI